MIALAIGVVVVVTGMLLVILPLLTRAARQAYPIASGAEQRDADAVPAIDALREIEFDRATGKISDADYASLRATYAPQALADMRQAATRGARECATCHITIVDPGARFCAGCGLPLAA